MKRAIVVNADYRFMSALVDRDTARLLKEGDRIRARKALDLDYYGKLQPGETGKVVYVDVTTGLVEIMFDNYLEQLHHWRNCILLVPFDTPNWIDGLELVSVWEQKEIAPVLFRTKEQPITEAI